MVYAVSETEEGAVAAFRPTGGGLTALGPAVAVGGAGPTHLSVAAGRLFTANYTSGGVSSLPLAADGTPLGPPAVHAHRGSGPDPERQERPHAHQVLPDPTGRWILSVDLGTDSVRVCLADPETGALRPHAETALRAGTGPRHLAFHPDGSVLYVLHELEPQLTVCRWDAGSGRLEPVAEVPVAAAAAPGGARVYPSAVVVSRTGGSCGRPCAAPTPSPPSRSRRGPRSRGSRARWTAGELAAGPRGRPLGAPAVRGERALRGRHLVRRGPAHGTAAPGRIGGRARRHLRGLRLTPARPPPGARARHAEGPLTRTTG